MSLSLVWPPSSSSEEMVELHSEPTVMLDSGLSADTLDINIVHNHTTSPNVVRSSTFNDNKIALFRCFCPSFSAKTLKTHCTVIEFKELINEHSS